VAALKNMLRQNTGLTLLTGGDAEKRAFLLTALGHAFCRLDPAHRKPAGIDLCEPAKWVPIETLTYLRDPHRPSETLAAIAAVWPTLVCTQHPIVLLNGIWALAPKLQPHMLKLANRRQVILADEEISLPANFTLKSGLPVYRLTVSRSRKNPHWLEVAIQVE